MNDWLGMPTNRDLDHDYGWKPTFWERAAWTPLWPWAVGGFVVGALIAWLWRWLAG